MYCICDQCLEFSYAGSSEKSVSDCRTEGCTPNSECIREQAFFVCRCLPGYIGDPKEGCQRGKYSYSKSSCFFFNHLHIVYST